VRIPFPVHVPLSRVTCFAGILFLIQLSQGTSAVFAIFCFIFIFLTGATFNLAGGFSRTSGVYVFAYAVLVVILGVCWKAVLGEPADSNLAQPQLTMKIYAGSMAVMFLAVGVSRKLTLKRPVLGNLVTDANMQNATVGCLITGSVIYFLMLVTDQRQEGTLLSALSQVNRFLPMALIFGVIHEVRKTGGRRSVNLAVLLSGGIILFIGLIGFSKELIFTPLLCWILAVGSQGYRLSKAQVAGLVFVVFLMVHYLVPYSQYARNFEVETVGARIGVAVDLLGDLEDVRYKYQEARLDYYANQSQAYFNTPQGFMDRLQMISMDDGLIDITEKRTPIGPIPILMGFQNLVPHFIWPGKPALHFGNIYAHEMGGLSADDDTTGISFSPAGEAYHIQKWFGVLIWAPLLWIMLFVVFDSLCGDLRTHPWGLLVGAFFAHLAPEGMLGGIIHAVGVTGFGLVMAAFAAAYLMPILGALIKGPERVTIRRIGPVRSIPRRDPYPVPQQGIGQ